MCTPLPLILSQVQRVEQSQNTKNKAAMLSFLEFSSLNFHPPQIQSFCGLRLTEKESIEQPPWQQGSV
jgi:1-deoxy-D-xylulose 5-phosphate reductoisomerase